MKPGGEEWLWDQLADGRTVASVAEELGVSRRYLYVWRDRRAHKHRLKPLWEAAIRMSAEADLEKTMAEFARLDRVIERVTPDGEIEREERIPHASEVQLVSGRAKLRQWLAAKKDPEVYGDRVGVDVKVDLGDMHMAALQAADTVLLPRDAGVVEAEVLSYGPPGDEAVEEGDDLTALLAE